MTSFPSQLAEAVRSKRTPIVVGLDPRTKNLPAKLTPDTAHPKAVAAAYRTFCKQVIDVVASKVPAVKPQAAFFEQLGPEGFAAMGEVIEYAKQQGLLVILDGKRNDIGSTATAYADAYLGRDRHPWSADALTINPYLGSDSLQPFVDAANSHDAGLFVLVKTSNPGGGMLQDLVANGKAVYRHVAEMVETLARQEASENGTAYGNTGAVVGATYPEQLAELREVMPHAWILVPGFGSQGGTAEDVAAAFDEQGLGALVNNSRGIIFAYEREPFRHYAGSDWQRAVELATEQMIEQLRTVSGGD